MFRVNFLRIILCLCFTSNVAWCADPGDLTAEWKFDEGQGAVAHDSSGQGNNATIHGATWVKQGDGFALSFDGLDNTVDGGENQALEIVGGPITLEVWIKPTRKAYGEASLMGNGLSGYLLTYYSTEVCNWYIGSGANGITGHLTLDRWNHVVATFDGKRMNMWVNGQLTRSRESKYESYKVDGHLSIGVKGRPDLSKFKGLMDNVRVYDRAISSEEAIAHFKTESAGYGFDPTWFSRVKVIPHYYLDRGEIVVEADYKGLMPLQGKGRLEVILSNKEQPKEIIRRQAIDELPESGVVEVRLSSRELTDGDYVIRATLRDESGVWPVEEFAFPYPAKPVPLPSPTTKTVDPLPAPLTPTPFEVTVGKAGGFQINTKGASYSVQSRVSWPNGDFNRLIPGDQPYGGGEKSWSTRTQAIGTNRYAITAEGEFYTIQRDVEVFPTHVYVQDTYTNTTATDLGLLIYNEIPVKPGQVTQSYLSGNEKGGRLPVMSYPDYSPTLFFNDATSGMGVIPIDDVFVVQAVPYVEKGAAGLCTEKFALPPGKSYTLEWAIYPTGSGDYYDFINTFRKVEDRISTVKGAPGFISWGPMNRRQVPDKDYIEKRGMKIGIISCLSQAADDPQLSIEGIEFMDFPREMMLLKGQAATIHRRHPGFKVVLHIAHSLYMTNDAEKFADSKVILADGKQAIWGVSDAYVSKQRQKEGWTWRIYYPTPGNSFHNAMMKSVDVLMDDMGMDGGFMDGFMAAYMSSWTYDTDLRWDGHSAEIDLETKTIRRKMSSVVLLSLPSMIEYSRKIRDKGGVVIGNSAVFTRSIVNEKYIIYDSECASGPALHTAPSVTALRGSTGPVLTEKSIYLDMLDKLSWGMLFLYYSERINLTYPSLASKQFPMTFEEIRSGLVRGKERIVTMNSGVYGWPGKRDLHMVFKYDDRGAPVSHDSVTTIDADSVRTELIFGVNESAVIEPIPVTLEASSPVNVRVLDYEDTSMNILLNGQGEAKLEMFVGTFYPDKRDGVFLDGGVNPADIGVGALYRVTVAGKATTLKEIDGTLLVPLKLNGQVEVIIEVVDNAK